MSYSLIALVGRAATLAGTHTLVPLRFGLVLLPLTDEVVRAHESPAQPPFIECDQLPAGVAEWARELSKKGPVAYIEAEYEAGDGWQAAVVWRHEQRIYGPERRARGPVNGALRLLGVAKGTATDEFEALGLGQQPTTTAWSIVRG
jgi:hypothetical protein